MMNFGWDIPAYSELDIRTYDDLGNGGCGQVCMQTKKLKPMGRSMQLSCERSLSNVDAGFKISCSACAGSQGEVLVICPPV
jgi:hypothetical protein